MSENRDSAVKSAPVPTSFSALGSQKGGTPANPTGALLQTQTLTSHILSLRQTLSMTVNLFLCKYSTIEQGTVAPTARRAQDHSSVLRHMH